MYIYNCVVGERIDTAAKNACSHATLANATIELEFNDVRVLVEPHDSPREVVLKWERGMDEAAAAYRASPEGIRAAKEAAERLAKLQAQHDQAMMALPAKFGSARSAIEWLISFYDAGDHIEVVGRDFDRVADVLETSGWQRNEACSLPKEEYKNAATMGRYVIGQAIDMLRKGLPPHPVLMEKFAVEYLNAARGLAQ